MFLMPQQLNRAEFQMSPSTVYTLRIWDTYQQTHEIGWQCILFSHCAVTRRKIGSLKCREELFRQNSSNRCLIKIHVAAIHRPLKRTAIQRPLKRMYYDAEVSSSWANSHALVINNESSLPSFPLLFNVATADHRQWRFSMLRLRTRSHFKNAFICVRRVSVYHACNNTSKRNERNKAGGYDDQRCFVDAHTRSAFLRRNAILIYMYFAHWLRLSSFFIWM